ncbi:MAG: hypothetical protein ACRENP_20010 [Longimicrobiales bacterium]
MGKLRRLGIIARAPERIRLNAERTSIQISSGCAKNPRIVANIPVTAEMFADLAALNESTGGVERER